MKALVFTADCPDDLEGMLNKFFDLKRAAKVDIEVIRTDQTFIPFYYDHHGSRQEPKIIYTMLYKETSWA